MERQDVAGKPVGRAGHGLPLAASSRQLQAERDGQPDEQCRTDQRDPKVAPEPRWPARARLGHQRFWLRHDIPAVRRLNTDDRCDDR